MLPKGNDVERSSAPLLGKVRATNAACAIGPLIGRFGKGHMPEDVRQAELAAPEREYETLRAGGYFEQRDSF